LCCPLFLFTEGWRTLRYFVMWKIMLFFPPFWGSYQRLFFLCCDFFPRSPTHVFAGIPLCTRSTGPLLFVEAELQGLWCRVRCFPYFFLNSRLVCGKWCSFSLALSFVPSRLRCSDRDALLFSEFILTFLLSCPFFSTCLVRDCAGPI